MHRRELAVGSLGSCLVRFAIAARSEIWFLMNDNSYFIASVCLVKDGVDSELKCNGSHIPIARCHL